MSLNVSESFCTVFAKSDLILQHVIEFCYIVIVFCLFPVVDTVEEFGEPIEKDSRAPRGGRPIFECYWNGRLIPYTAVDV